MVGIFLAMSLPCSLERLDGLVISGGEDDPRAPDSDRDNDSAEECFSVADNNETDCSSVPGDDAGDSLDSVPDDKIYDNPNDALDDAGAWLMNQDEEKPPEYYLAEEANLDPSRLRQRRYSPRTQEKLDWVKEHWGQ